MSVLFFNVDNEDGANINTTISNEGSNILEVLDEVEGKVEMEKRRF